MLKNLSVIIFDCDGVMFDTTKANRAFYNVILDHFGMEPLTDAQFEYAQMHTVEEAVAHLFFETPEKIDAVHAFRKKKGYHEFIPRMEMEPGLVPLLRGIRPGLKTAIATNRTDTMNRVLREFSLEDLFDLVVTALDVPNPKPAPDQLLRVLDHFRLNPSQALFIGDSQLDQMASEAAGVPFAAFNNHSLSADMHLSSFEQLARMLTIH